MLQAPDLLGVPSALDLAAIAPEVVKNALRMKKIGNELLKAIGGRSVHPVNACVGGWYRWPESAALNTLLPELEWALEAAKETVKWSLTLNYPDLEIDYEFVAIHNPAEYGVIRGDIWSSNGSKLPWRNTKRGILKSTSSIPMLCTAIRRMGVITSLVHWLA